MTGIRRLRTAQDFIYSPDTINAAMDAMARDIASAVTGDSIAAENDDHDWKVVTGLQIYSEGDNDIAMTPGVAVGKAAGVPRLLTIWSGIEAFADSLPVADADDPRIDLVCLVVSEAGIASSVEGRVNDVPTTVATQTGPVATLTIVPGTPDPAPVAPALPAGAILLAYCLTEPAPAGTVTILDKRPFATGPRKRIPDHPIDFIFDPEFGPYVGKAELVNVNFRAETLDALGPTPPPSSSGLRWDMVIDYPVFTRSRSDGSEWTGDACPMLIPQGREYWLTFPCLGTPSRSNTSPSPEKLGIVAGPNYLEIYETTQTGTDVMELAFPLPWQARNLEVVEAEVLYEVVNAFSQTSVTFAVQRMDWGGGAWDNILYKQIASMPAPVALTTLDLTDVGSDPLGEWWRLLVYAQKASGAGLGTSRLRVYGVRVKVREGREY